MIKWGDRPKYSGETVKTDVCRGYEGAHGGSAGVSAWGIQSFMEYITYELSLAA